MTAPETEKLKALALAYLYENGEHWFNEFELADGVTYEPGLNFIIAANPATVLALIAEVERLQGDAGRYRAWRKCVQTENQAFIDAVSDALPSEDSDATFTDEQWDCAIDAAIEKEKA